MNKLLFIILLTSCSLLVHSQEVLDQYVQEGLKNNLVLQQKQIDYNKSIYVLKEARSYFMPSVNLQARYTWADGGRVIDMPVGDMINPVYTTLNQITSAMHELGLATEDQIFPDTSIGNQKFNFYRDKEHETKLRLTQAIFNPAIYYNYKIQNQLAEIKKADITTYVNQLAGDIQVAYYNYIKALEFMEIIEESEALLQENLRVNTKLFENDMLTKEAVYQSQTEISKLNKQKAEVEKGINMARAYFNFLLNHNFEEEITVINNDLPLIAENVSENADNAVTVRGEVEMLNKAVSASDLGVKLTKSNALPTLAAVVDYGFQGEKYKFTSDDDFMLVSLVLQWKLFGGLYNKQKISQSVLEREKLVLQKENAENQIRLQVMDVYYTYQAATKAVIASENQVKSSEKSFEIINKKYSNGQAGMLEYMAAQNELTQAKQNLAIDKFQLRIAYIEYQKAMGSYGTKYSVENNNE